MKCVSAPDSNAPAAPIRHDGVGINGAHRSDAANGFEADAA